MKPTVLGAAMALFVSLATHAAEPIWDANKVEMVSEKLGEGVYAYLAADAARLNASGGAAATSGGLIVGSKGALLIDTLLNKRLNTQVQKLSDELAGKPLLYAVNTSSHGDHSYGNMYLPATTRIVQHARARAFIEQHLEDDKAFMLQNFGAGRGIEEITARPGDILIAPDSRISLDLGGRTVEVIDFGFGQTGGDLWVWEPNSKVLWSGNPVIASKPALPWLLDGHLVATLETLTRVHEFLPDDARIVPGHGVPITRADLGWHIGYLAAVRKQVQAAVDEGLSLEQTVQRVTLPNYRGYVLFDWVHPGLNVPAAYRDLSKK